MTKQELLLKTAKSLNAAYAAKKFKKAYDLLVLSNNIRVELNEVPLTLPFLESMFNKA